MKRRKDGLFAAQVYLGSEPVLGEDGKPIYDEYGKAKTKRKYKTIYGKTQKEVKSKATELRLKIGKGIDIAAAEESFLVWSERYIKGKQAEGAGYKHVANMKVFHGHLTAIHGTALEKVKASDIQEIINALAVHHDGKRPLSKRTLTGIKQYAAQVYKMAIGARVVDYNPATYVTIPKNASVTHRTAIAEEQQVWVRETPHRAQTAAMVMLYSGLRIGEALALTWADVDFEEATITVSKSITVEGATLKIKSPKTEAGNRIVDVPDTLIGYLQNIKGMGYTTLVIPAKNGGHFKLTGWYYVWDRYMDTLQDKYEDFERFTPHQLRHTFCTLLYAAGYSLIEARDQMGHKDIQTTANIYTHLDKLTGRKTKGKLTRFLNQYDASKDEEENTRQG